MATAFFRITQELLTNVIRHANASDVTIDFRTDRKNALVLLLHDNGVGMTPQGERKKGSLGILGMRERAMLFGRELTITGEQGRRTTALVMIPIQAALRREQALSGTRS